MNLGRRHQLHRKKTIMSLHSSLAKRSVDMLAYIVSILSLLFTVDQVRIIWIEQNAAGVSFLSWTFYTISALVWFFYGIIHRDRVLIITNFLWVMFSFFIVVGIVMYG